MIRLYYFAGVSRSIGKSPLYFWTNINSRSGAGPERIFSKSKKFNSFENLYSNSGNKK